MRCLLAAATLAAAAAAQTLVVPSAVAAADGNSSSGWPFDVAAARLLYVYDSSHFTANGVAFPILISRIRFRANATAAVWSGSSATLQMDLSTAPVDYTLVSTTWNANHGADRATVYNGAWSIAAGSSTAGGPGPFYATVTFTQPFLYDPSLGDLTIDTTSSGISVANTPTMDAVTTAGVANAKRVYSLTSPPAATATAWGADLANVLEFTYTPAAGLHAGFVADVTGGASPLAVHFSDQSFTSDAGGITSWAWDLDGDSIVDSTAPNPSFVYTNCGTYSVSLTVTDATHPPSTLVRTAYVATDLIAADFTTQVVGPRTVQFTDASNMPATSWAWDLDGDTVVDSTAPNPTWVYQSASPVAVTLTTTRLCSPPSVVTRSVVPVQSISHNVTANNGLSAGATVYFDCTVTNPAGVNLGGLDVIGSVANTAFSVDVYVRPGSYAGVERTPSAWTRVGTGTGTTTTTTAPAAVALAAPIYLPAGSYGIALQYLGVGPRYNGTAASGPLQTVGNADLTLTLGAACATSAAAPFTSGSSPINLRFWSGTIYYGTHDVTGEAGFGFFAPGCAGSLGVTSLTANRPQLGTTLAVQLNNLPLSAAILMTGFSNTSSAFGPLPLDLAPFGAPGCFGRVSPDATLFVFGAANAATWNFAVPNDPGLSGLPMFHQALVVDPGFNALGAVASDAAAMVLGL